VEITYIEEENKRILLILFIRGEILCCIEDANIYPLQAGTQHVFASFMYSMQLVIIGVDKKLFTGVVEKISIPASDGVFTILPSHTDMIVVMKKWLVDFLPTHTEYSALESFFNHTVRVPIQGGICKVTHDEIVLIVTAIG
jgi:hypothetical protein